MYRKRSSILSIKFKSISQINYSLNLFRFRSNISALRSDYPPVSDLNGPDHGSDTPSFQNTNAGAAQFNHLNGFHKERSDFAPVWERNGFQQQQVDPDKGNYSNGFLRNNQTNNSYRESSDISNNFVNGPRNSVNLTQTSNQYDANSMKGSRIGGHFSHLNNFQNFGGDSNGIVKERNDFSPNYAFDSRNTDGYLGNHQTSNFGDQNSVAAGQFSHLNMFQNSVGLGNGIHNERTSFSAESKCNGHNQQTSYVIDTKVPMNLQQSVSCNQASNFYSNIGAAEVQREGSRVDGQFNQMNNFQNVNYMGTSDFSQYSSANGSYDQNQNVTNSTNLQQNSNGYVQQLNSNGTYKENMYGHSNNVTNVASRFNDQFGHRNDNQKFRANEHNLYAVNAANLQNSSYGNQRDNFGEVQQWNNSVFNKGNSNGNINNIHLERSNFGAQYNQMNNVQNTSNGYQRNNLGEVQQSNFYGAKAGITNGYLMNNFTEVRNLNSDNGYQRNNQYVNNVAELKIGRPINNDKELGVDDGYPYENQSGFFRKGQIKLDQELTKNPIPNNQDFNVYESVETSRIINFEDCTYMLGAFCEEGKVKEAVAILAVLEKIGMDIDISLYLKLVQACGNEKSLDNAKIVHEHLSWSMNDVKVSVHNEILDMYSKCGSMTDAYKLFVQMTEKNNASWVTMIRGLRGLANNGLGEEAIDLFNEFKKMGLKPDRNLFNSVFYTCGVLSAVDQGMLYYKSMRVDFGISPDMENYASMVEMLGRSGHLDEAFEFIESMPSDPNVDIWITLLNLCRINGYIELGNRCSEIVEQYDSSKLSDESRKGLLPLKSLESLKDNEIKQNHESTNARHQTHEFMAGRTNNHILNEHIRCLAQQMKEAGYVPDISCSLHDVDPENREEALMFHSERLAMVHGLMTSPARRDMRIIKNLRVCRDCHNVMKIISKLTGRLIIARDNKRFHHVKDGICSCNDFW